MGSLIYMCSTEHTTFKLDGTRGAKLIIIYCCVQCIVQLKFVAT